jgi:hypothetical protein
MRQNVCGYLSERLAFLLAEGFYVFGLSQRPARFAGTRDFRHSSRRTSSGEKAGGVGRNERGSREAPATEDIARGERSGHQAVTGRIRHQPWAIGASPPSVGLGYVAR